MISHPQKKLSLVFSFIFVFAFSFIGSAAPNDITKEIEWTYLSQDQARLFLSKVVTDKSSPHVRAYLQLRRDLQSLGFKDFSLITYTVHEAIKKERPYTDRAFTVGETLFLSIPNPDPKHPCKALTTVSWLSLKGSGSINKEGLITNGSVTGLESNTYKKYDACPPPGGSLTGGG